MKLIEAREIGFSFNRYPVLDRVHFDLMCGETVGLIGPNGAGKSTLIRILMGLLTRRSGDLRVLNKPFEKIGSKYLAREAAYLPQGQEIYWPLSAEKIVSLGRTPFISPWQKLGAEDEDAVRRAMEETDTLRFAGRPVDQLAGGERRLVMIARVLAGNPRIILADEPVAGLDPTHQIQVMELLRTLSAKGRGTVVVLHDLTLAARFCDRVYLMHEGKMMADGPPLMVLSPENLRKSYRIEAQYGHHEKDFYVLPWKRI
jgi:iron complex transport system ATP-binding protein